MIDTTAMILCIASQGFLAWKSPRVGFALSIVGSGLWFFYAFAVQSPALMLQSMAFLTFSAVGLVKS